MAKKCLVALWRPSAAKACEELGSHQPGQAVCSWRGASPWKIQKGLLLFPLCPFYQSKSRAALLALIQSSVNSAVWVQDSLGVLAVILSTCCWSRIQEKRRWPGLLDPRSRATWQQGAAQSYSELNVMGRQKGPSCKSCSSMRKPRRRGKDPKTLLNWVVVEAFWC